jgi:hypothetical protein
MQTAFGGYPSQSSAQQLQMRQMMQLQRMQQLQQQPVQPTPEAQNAWNSVEPENEGEAMAWGPDGDEHAPPEKPDTAQSQHEEPQDFPSLLDI